MLSSSSKYCHFSVVQNSFYIQLKVMDLAIYKENSCIKQEMSHTDPTGFY